ncbi:MAG: hypothetical protein KBC95_03020 [Candidatus Peribacteraceae bacterium]|nr:hypothetical protein [Candidatus Peribacteraceae bacterium]
MYDGLSMLGNAYLMSDVVISVSRRRPPAVDFHISRIFSAGLEREADGTLSLIRVSAESSEYILLHFTDCQDVRLVRGEIFIGQEVQQEGYQEGYIAFRGVLEFSVDEERRYLSFVPGQTRPHVYTLREFTERERRRAKHANRRAAARKQHRDEAARWSTVSTEETIQVMPLTCRHLPSRPQQDGHLWLPDTHLIVQFLEQPAPHYPVVDPSDTYAISVHAEVLDRTGWDVLTNARIEVLRAALPLLFTARRMCEYEQRDTGERRGEVIWYELDPDSLKCWIERALSLS